MRREILIRVSALIVLLTSLALWALSHVAETELDFYHPFSSKNSLIVELCAGTTRFYYLPDSSPAGEPVSLHLFSAFPFDFQGSDFLGLIWGYGRRTPWRALEIPLHLPPLLSALIAFGCWGRFHSSKIALQSMFEYRRHPPPTRRVPRVIFILVLCAANVVLGFPGFIVWVPIAVLTFATILFSGDLRRSPLAALVPQNTGRPITAKQWWRHGTATTIAALSIFIFVEAEIRLTGILDHSTLDNWVSPLFWVPALVFALLPAVVLVRVFKQNLSRLQQQSCRLRRICPTCSYDLCAHLQSSNLTPQDSSPPRCPECGTPIISATPITP